MILTEAEIKNLMTTYHGNEAFVIGVAVGKSIEFDKAKKAFCTVCGCKECAKRNITCAEYKEFVMYIKE